ncbi:MAG TPA: type II toxin-antitoxin system RelE/ParE family toxin [Aromatoleum sp.]|uniref:type II toxin-antitoxin system RelE/ParE family toxin n=1 Tax=Aromatoleum sp. TaxID=2307007 RepID=UPI002B4901D4|nr:type II toxin-antitoxin system RelE/ParE family toxin [Aromatoleum sp.]HJV25870.1 type II toxin-antitoxin system RelE/ParE family toxin [Aromatoleum sp.]
MPRQESPKATVKLTANFERNLEEIERFLTGAEAPQAFDALLDELTDTVIPNLERFPAMGRSFLSRSIRSVEASNGVDILRGKLIKIGENAEIREYVLQHYLLLYACIESEIHLLSIRHHKQLSFDFQHLWTDR